MTDLTVHSIDHTIDPLNTAGAGAATGGRNGGDFGTFLDTVLDIVNPLQHLPVVSTLYRSITGDEIAAPARVIGGALFGGPLGAAGAVVNLAVEDATGRDIGEHTLALLTGEDADTDMQLASLDGPPPPLPPRGDAVMVAYRDYGAMLADYETWNGEWQAPAGAAAPQTAAVPAAPAQAVARAPQPPAGPPADPAPQPTPPVANATVNAAAEPPASAKPAETPQAPARLAVALAEAEQQQTGRGEPAIEEKTGAGESPEWISAAMAHALDKYQAMAIARSAEQRAAHAATAKSVETR